MIARVRGASLRPLWALVVAALLFLPGCAGCRREIHFEPAEDDSTRVRSADSLRSLMRRTLAAWDGGETGEEAARLSSIVVREVLQTHPDERMETRARRLLDSLDIGAEIAADGRIAAINFFARARPDAGAWPYLYWRTPRGVNVRPLAGRSLQLLQVATRPDGSGDPGAWAQAAVLFARRSSAGQEPLLMVWTPPAGGPWTPLQTLGPDSLGGVGAVAFEVEGDTAIVLTSRTFRGMPRFEECATCPHVYQLHRFRWEASGFVRFEDRAVPSPYATFVQFVLALGSGDQAAATALVADPALLDQARLFEFAALPKGMWRVAPATDENAASMIFFRGQQEAYQVSFEPRGDQWAINGIRPTTRTIE